ncbi:MAG: 2TM domain-containing protein [Deltaproteobacteria bacterium]|jgi:signal transduction histidine kinase|nr:2TM domain-containing protein [Deltaproteobacteria bacterium]
MIGLLILVIVIFAIRQHRRSRALKWRDHYWRNDDFRRHVDQAEQFAAEFPHRLAAKIQRQAERSGSDFERKMADKFERHAAQFEKRLHRKFARQSRWSDRVWWRGPDEARSWERHVEDLAADPSQPAAAAGPQKTDDGGLGVREGLQASAEAYKAYQRARKRAAAEAGFYVHLMWYGVVIGFLFFINLMTTSFQWWVFPAIGWGFGVGSHFIAVFGWRWIHERVFEPAIQREIDREVTREKEVLRTEKQASLDELTATFAHEIRNPIAAAKSLVQQMGEDPTSVENVEYAKVALDELARVERSVSHLLKYAKEEDYNFDNVNLAGVLDGALTQLRSKLEANSVKVSRNYLTGPTVRADADKLRQVFSNMIDNAIDAMGSTTGERRLEVAIHRGRGGVATVIVRDNGCGIPEDKQAKIFNPFYTSKQNGTGLGLGVAKKVIDAHRGTIEVSSELGVGTEFLVSIPLADAVRETPADATEPLPGAPATTSISMNGSAASETPLPITAQGASPRGPQ